MLAPLWCSYVPLFLYILSYYNKQLFYPQLRCLGSRFWDGDWPTRSLLGNVIQLTPVEGEGRKQASSRWRSWAAYIYKSQKNLWSTSRERWVWNGSWEISLVGGQQAKPDLISCLLMDHLLWATPESGFLFSRDSSWGGLAAGGCSYILPNTGRMRPLVFSLGSTL